MFGKLHLFLYSDVQETKRLFFLQKVTFLDVCTHRQVFCARESFIQNKTTSPRFIVVPLCRHTCFSYMSALSIAEPGNLKFSCLLMWMWRGLVSHIDGCEEVTGTTLFGYCYPHLDCSRQIDCRPLHIFPLPLRSTRRSGSIVLTSYLLTSAAKWRYPHSFSQAPLLFLFFIRKANMRCIDEPIHAGTFSTVFIRNFFSRSSEF